MVKIAKVSVMQFISTSRLPQNEIKSKAKAAL